MMSQMFTMICHSPVIIYPNVHDFKQNPRPIISVFLSPEPSDILCWYRLLSRSDTVIWAILSDDVWNFLHAK